MVSLASFRRRIASLEARCLALLVMDEPWSAADGLPPAIRSTSRRRHAAPTSIPRKPLTVRREAGHLRAGAPHG